MNTYRLLACLRVCPLLDEYPEPLLMARREKYRKQIEAKNRVRIVFASPHLMHHAALIEMKQKQES
ncbi:MAG: hypothetical protein EHM33_00855 [Chloroflexi bacterium]|nr:MAG: hypothetical protein EHM33_00855 [Chloroflexota bacterium]